MISFDFSKPSILRNMFLAFMSFGFVMGVVFPIFANLFVEWKDGMLVWFILSCIAAGLSIGLFNFWLLNKMLLQRLQRIGEVANSISNNDISQKCSLQSHDFIGAMADSFNLMSQNLRDMIHRGASEHDMERHAHSCTRNLLGDGRDKVLAGVTSVAEVMRVTRED